MIKVQSINSIEALKMSIQCEMDMQEYYLRAAAIVKNDDAEAILKGLTEKASKHRQALIRAYSKLSGKKILYLKLGRRHKLSSLVKCTDDANEAVRNAKKNEQELKSFYLTVSRRLLESDMRQLFRELAMEQEQHFALLESSFEEPLNLDEEPIEAETAESDIMSELASA